MCTYDYTPYTGCGDGQQHYYIQWVKCGVAVENGRYCSLQKSTEVEQLRKLSANVLSCPLHGPIAVQQYVLDPANAILPEGEPGEAEAGTRAGRRTARSRSRTPARSKSRRDPEQPRRKEVRTRRSRRQIAPESSDSESSSSTFRRPRTADRPRRTGDREAVERRKSRAAQLNSHRRSISADVALLPPPALSMRHGRSEVSLPGLPLETEQEVQAGEQHASSTGPPPPPPQANLAIPLGNGVIGLPSSPDMHRRASVHRSRSEGLLRQGTQDQLESVLPAQPAARSTVSPSSDSSPDHNPDLPFSMQSRRGRRAGTRSIRNHSVDTAMRPIDEHAGLEEGPADRPSVRQTPTPETRSTTTTSPEPQHPAPDARHMRLSVAASSMDNHKRESSRPRLNTLQIPQTRDKYQRDAYSAPTATVPDHNNDLHPPRTLPQRTRTTKSLRHVDSAISGLQVTPAAAAPAHPFHDSETASLRSVRSRRRFDQPQQQQQQQHQQQVHQPAEGRRWAAAAYEQHFSPQFPPASMNGSTTDVLAHMSVPNLPLASTGGPAVAGRESVDSGYRSGQQSQHHQQHHHPQRSWETVLTTTTASTTTSATANSNGTSAPKEPATAGKPVSGSSSSSSSNSSGANAGGNKPTRNTLHKPPPPQPSQPSQPSQLRSLAGGGGPRPKPAPLDLSSASAAARSRAMMMSVPLTSPGPTRPHLDGVGNGVGTGPGGVGGIGNGGGGGGGGGSSRATLLQRMGLRKKISGLLMPWDRADRGGGGGSGAVAAGQKGEVGPVAVGG